MRIITIYNISLFLSLVPLWMSAQQHPGGVAGAEVWYIANEFDIQYGHFTDHSQYPKDINPCGDSDIEKAYFNFNPSLFSENLCLVNRGSLERSLNRSMFIVSEPDEDPRDKVPYPHFGTQYNEHLFGSAYNDSLSMNTYVLETVQGFGSRMVASFSQHQFANVHFYSWNNYDIDSIRKSYGLLGETDFFVGKKISHPELSPGPDFSGLMPEYVTYDRSLTENERNRVESYLALKYGITKWNTDHYLDSQNKVFWDKANYKLFYNNIFGIGRDDISMLNQMQCESAHARDFLVAATHEILSTNAEHWGNYELTDREFLVFGDTESEEVIDATSENLNLNRLRRVWLSQVRGDRIKEIPIRFRLDLMRAFEAQPHLVDEVINEELTLWMLHDVNVNNSYVSDFDNGNVKFYKPFTIDYGSNGEVYAHFGEDDIFFDRDNSFFDQFTFAIGPECLVQFQPRYNCDEIAQTSLECYELDIILIGHCDGELELLNEHMEHLDVWYNEEQTEINNYPTYTAQICAPDTHTLIIHTRNGSLEFHYDATIIEQFYVNLGENPQFLGPGNSTIPLDAGHYLNDDRATYQWFYDGEQIYHTGSILIVDEPGIYCVKVTSGDGLCVFEQCVEIILELDVTINCHQSGCLGNEYEIQIVINNGTPPYSTTVVQTPSTPFSTSNTHVHNGNLNINGTLQGEPSEYTITVTDSLGAVYTHTCYFEGVSSYNQGSLGPDLTLNSSNTSYTLDASSMWGGPHNHIYEWFQDGIPYPNNNTPQLTVTKPGTYVAKIYFPDNDCYGYATQNVYSVLEGQISSTNGCDEFSNTIAVDIDYGFSPYNITIIGSIAGGGNYSHFQQGFAGNFMFGNIPFGNHTVTVTDRYGSQITENINFEDPMENVEIDLIHYLEYNNPVPVVQVCYYMPLDQKIACDCCSANSTDYIEVNGNPGTILDASQGINNPNDFTFEWFKNGVSTGIYTPQVFFGIIPPYGSGIDEYMVRATHVSNGCFIEDSFYAYGFFEIMEYNPLRPPIPTEYITKIYPNPSDTQATFYYQINTTSEQSFGGRVELYNILGQLIFSNSIQGQTEYTLPYVLLASGTYIIRTTLDDGTVKVDRIIIK